MSRLLWCENLESSVANDDVVSAVYFGEAYPSAVDFCSVLAVEVSNNPAFSNASQTTMFGRGTWVGYAYVAATRAAKKKLAGGASEFVALAGETISNRDRFFGVGGLLLGMRSGRSEMIVVGQSGPFIKGFALHIGIARRRLRPNC